MNFLDKGGCAIHKDVKEAFDIVMVTVIPANAHRNRQVVAERRHGKQGVGLVLYRARNESVDRFAPLQAERPAIETADIAHGTGRVGIDLEYKELGNSPREDVENRRDKRKPVKAHVRVAFEGGYRPADRRQRFQHRASLLGHAALHPRRVIGDAFLCGTFQVTAQVYCAGYGSFLALGELRDVVQRLEITGQEEIVHRHSGRLASGADLRKHVGRKPAAYKLDAVIAGIRREGEIAVILLVDILEKPPCDLPCRRRKTRVDGSVGAVTHAETRHRAGFPARDAIVDIAKPGQKILEGPRIHAHVVHHHAQRGPRTMIEDSDHHLQRSGRFYVSRQEIILFAIKFRRVDFLKGNHVFDAVRLDNPAGMKESGLKRRMKNRDIAKGNA